MTLAALRDRDCPICGSADARPEVVSTRRADYLPLADLTPFWFGIEKARCFFSYHRCSGCGLLYNPIFFGEAQLGELYATMPPNMNSVDGDAIAATQRGYFDAVAAACPLDGDYLEIGPDVGHIAGEAARRGRFDRFWLFEPNREVHDILSAAVSGQRARVFAGMSNLNAVPDGSVGLAVMVHLLDHLLDPVGMLEAVHRKLRPGGTLMLVTHDERSLLRRVLGPRWPAFCLQHPELYNPATIRRAVTQAGFADVAITRSRNVFPIDFLARQAGAALGVRTEWMPLPRRAIGLRLGNIMTLARRSTDQPAAMAVAERVEISA
ncbi:class I SAM-dependent methyltransferase [Sphingomonas sp. PL20]|uniref:class I SAM-dependent methyltransferase n=1 Tax=Sphingomonas sp. PL20 TaxID=2760712 RepID=UPI001AE78545